MKIEGKRNEKENDLEVILIVAFNCRMKIDGKFSFSSSFFILVCEGEKWKFVKINIFNLVED